MTPAELDELTRLAREASSSREWPYGIVSAPDQRDYDFIAAANPSTVIAMVRRIRELEAATESYGDRCQRLDVVYRRAAAALKDLAEGTEYPHCQVSRLGEVTLECRHDAPCDACIAGQRVRHLEAREAEARSWLGQECNIFAYDGNGTSCIGCGGHDGVHAPDCRLAAWLGKSRVSVG